MDAHPAEKIVPKQQARLEVHIQEHGVFNK